MDQSKWGIPRARRGVCTKALAKAGEAAGEGAGGMGDSMCNVIVAKWSTDNTPVVLEGMHGLARARLPSPG